MVANAYMRKQKMHTLTHTQTHTHTRTASVRNEMKRESNIQARKKDRVQNMKEGFLVRAGRRRDDYFSPCKLFRLIWQTLEASLKPPISFVHPTVW